LVAAIIFNILMTRRITSQISAQASAATETSPVPPPPPSPVQAAPQTPTPDPVVVPPAPPPQVAVPVHAPIPAPQPNPEAKRTAPTPAAPVVQAKDVLLPALAGGAPRAQPETAARRSPSAPSPEGKKALDDARQAFEGDDFTRAIKKGREALELGEGRAHAILGAAYYKVGRFEDAVRAYKEALRLDPHNPSLEKRVELARRAATGHSDIESP
jgi:hypothetical protein